MAISVLRNIVLLYEVVRIRNIYLRRKIRVVRHDARVDHSDLDFWKAIQFLLVRIGTYLRYSPEIFEDLPAQISFGLVRFHGYWHDHFVSP